MFIIKRLKRLHGSQQVSGNTPLNPRMRYAICQIIAMSEGAYLNPERFNSKADREANWEDDADLTTLILNQYARQSHKYGCPINNKLVEYAKEILSAATHATPSAVDENKVTNGAEISQGNVVISVSKVIDEYKQDMKDLEKQIDRRVLGSCKNLLAVAAKDNTAPTEENRAPIVSLNSSSNTSEKVVTVLDIYSNLLKEEHNSLDGRVLEEIKDLIAKESAAKETESLPRKELDICGNDIKVAKRTLLEHLGSYLAKVKQHNKDLADGPSLEGEMVDILLLSALETLIE